MKKQVKIGPSFFQNAKLDYSNWKWALAREFMQNSIDCGSKNIGVNVTYHEDKGATQLIVGNDGSPMTREILEDKLLSLGESGKRFHGSVGGFGKAKELLYFCWERYSIESGEWEVKGSGAEYEINARRAKEPLHGTLSDVWIKGNVEDDLLRAFARFIVMSNVKCAFVLNNTLVEERLHKGYFRRDLLFAKAYTNRQLSNALVVRIDGTPMFTAYTRHPGCVVLELTGDSAATLTANRDSLQHEPRVQLEEFMADLLVNKRKALKQHRTQYLHYPGERCKAKGMEKQAKRIAQQGATLTQGKVVEQPTEAAVDLEVHPTIDLQVNLAASYSSQDEQERAQAAQLEDAAYQIATDLIIKNETSLTVKPDYRPDSPKFCRYAYRLLMIWTKVLLKIHAIYGIEDTFSVGFIFNDGGVIAQHEWSQQYGRVYFINPVCMDGSKWTKRFNYSKNKARGDLNQIVVSALHEVVHGLGYSDHDEDYSNKLTDMAGELLGHTKALIDCFRINPKHDN